MKNIYPVLMLLLVFSAMPGLSRGQELHALPAPAGIWLNAREVYNPDASLIISRKSGTGLETMTIIKSPSSLEEFTALYEESLMAQPTNEYVADSTLTAIWSRFNKYRKIDSLGLHSGNLHVLAGLGAAWFDADAVSGQPYAYKAEQVNGKVFTSESVSYPQRVQMGTIKPAVIQPTKDGVYLEFKIVNPGAMRSCKVYRSYYLRSSPELIAPLTIFTTRNGINYVVFTDYTAVPKVPYTYTVVPMDAAGNSGTPSDPISLFNAPVNSIPPSVRHLSTNSIIEKKAIQISWLPPASPDVISVELYRSKEYEGVYSKIASLRPDDTQYIDYDVLPVTTYYYTASINGSFEQSVNTPRVPGILRASNKSYHSPINLIAVRDGNVARLSWERSENDSRGYYLYRGIGYRGALKKIRSIILSKENSISFVDTLPVTMMPTVYTYAVTAENTSYNESPLSERASFQYASPETTVPIAADVTVVPSEDGHLRVIWSNLNESGTIGGYKLYRSVTDEAGNKIETNKTMGVGQLPARINFYSDGDIKEGFTYVYSVKAVSSSGEEGSISKESGYSVPINYPIQVSNIQVFASEQQVRLLWNPPQGTPLKKIELLRAETGETAKLVASFEPTTNSYTDKDVKKGVTYHYYFITESITERKSEPTIPVTAIVD